MRIEKTIDRDSKLKLYVQIYTIIKEKIDSGAWQAGTQIPTEDELCRTYDVSKVTVREAIQELVREGCLKRQQGKGTFVMYSVPQPGVVMRTRLSEDIDGEEVTAEREILERGIRGASGDIGNIMMSQDKVYYIRSKKVIGEETYTEEFFVPLFLLPDIDQEDIRQRSLYDLIEEKGTKKIFKIVQAVEVTAVKDDIAADLNLEKGSSALLISRILSGSDGTVLAYSRLIGGWKKHKFQMEFERIK